MTNTVKGLNAGVILHEGKFLALCLKVKKIDDSDECFYFQVPVLRDLLLILASRLPIINQQRSNGEQALSSAIAEEHARLMSYVPAIDAKEVEQPDNQRRITSAMVKPNIDNCTVHLIQQSEKISSLIIHNTQVEFILQAIMQVLKITNSPDLLRILTSTLDFLMLYDVEFKEDENIQYNQYSQEPWKQNLFVQHVKLIYRFQMTDGEDKFFGAIIKTNTQPKTAEIENMAQRVILFNERLKAYQDLPFQLYSDIIPAPFGIILTREECLKPLNDFRLKIAESLNKS